MEIDGPIVVFFVVQFFSFFLTREKGWGWLNLPLSARSRRWDRLSRTLDEPIDSFVRKIALLCCSRRRPSSSSPRYFIIECIQWCYFGRGGGGGVGGSRIEGTSAEKEEAQRRPRPVSRLTNQKETSLQRRLRLKWRRRYLDSQRATRSSRRLFVKAPKVFPYSFFFLPRFFSFCSSVCVCVCVCACVLAASVDFVGFIRRFDFARAFVFVSRTRRVQVNNGTRAACSSYANRVIAFTVVIE